MTEHAETAAWSYTPGDWFAVVGPATTLLMPPGDPERVAQLWVLVDDGAGFEEVLDALVAHGLSAMPYFALVGDTAEGTRVLVRGAGVIASVRAGGETIDLDGGAGGTWTERTLGDVEALTVMAGDATGERHLPLERGLVRVARVDRPEYVVPLPEPAGPPLTASTSDPSGVGAPEPPLRPPAEPPPGPPPPAPPVGLAATGAAPAEPAPEAADPEGLVPTGGAHALPAEPDPDGADPETAEPEAAGPGAPADADEQASPLDEGVATEAMPVPGAAGADPLSGPAPAEPPPPPPGADDVPPPPDLPPPPSAPPTGLPPVPDAPPPGEAPSDAPAGEAPAAPPEGLASSAAGDPSDPDHDGMTQAGADPGEFARPQPGIPGQPQPPSVTRPVAKLTISDGQEIEVDRVILVGRAPEARRFTSSEQPRLVTVPSQLQEISSTHIEVRPGAGADHGSAVVTDMGSTNGTVLVQPGLGPEELKPGIAVQLIPGAVINLGDGITIQVSRP